MHNHPLAGLFVFFLIGCSPEPQQSAEIDTISGMETTYQNPLSRSLNTDIQHMKKSRQALQALLEKQR